MLAYTIVHVAPQDNAGEVRQCMADHSLKKTHQDHLREDETRIFRACDWPALGGSGDGYNEITVTFGVGPGKSESTGANHADLVAATCSKIEFAYQYGSVGNYTNVKPFTVSTGNVVTFEGETWDGADPAPYPASNEIVVVHNTRAVLDTARCV